MSALPLGRYRELLGQLLHLNEQTAALRRELGAWIDSGAITDRSPTSCGSGGSVGVAPPTLNTDGPGRQLIASTQQLNETQAEEHRSTMESSNSSVAGSVRSSVNGELEPGQPYSNSSSSSHHSAPPVQERVRYGTTEAVIETGSSPRRTHQSPKYSHNGSKIPPKPLPRKNPPNTLDFEHIELIDEDPDEPTSSRKKPHFLDDDYQLQKSDICKIPKPHFLDHSPSPDDDRFSDITNPHFLDEASDICGPTRRKGHTTHPPPNINKQRESGQPSSLTRDKLEERNSMERRYRNDVQHNDFLPGQASTSSERHPLSVYDGGWNSDKDLWQSQDSCSVKSFSSAGSGNAISGASRQHLGPKENCVYSLLSLLSLSADSNADMSEYLLDMSHSVESCVAMRQSGCIPLLVQLIHSKVSRSSRNKAARALHNMVHAQPDDKAGRREARVLRLLEHVWEYCRFLEDLVECLREDRDHINDDMSKHPVQSVAALMKLSFDEEHRHVMCQLGGLQSLATLVTVDQSAHGSLIEHDQCITMRKYSGMALTNLTFGDGNNKALLCSFKDFMFALVEQLKSPNDDMRQVTAAVLRNLSWRADTASKKILREVGSVKGLTIAAMTGHKEATLKSVLSALWNLTAHCSLNKVDICSVEGALAFLVDMLSFNAPSKTLAIIENAGGILRNVSSHIAVREDYRQILRDRNCLKVLLQQLKSPSLTVVSNSCGTLWNLSARCQQDQQFLMDHGAIPMLRSLIHSKHKMIAMGSSAALKNLLNSKPGKMHILSLDSTARDMNLPALPTLGARKQKALEQELDQNLSETCENIEPVTSPSTTNRDEKLLFSAAEKHLAMNLDKHRMSSSSPLLGHLVSQISMSQSSHFGGGYLSCSNTLLLQSSLQKGHMSRTMLYGRSENVNRSESRDSVTSTHSDSVYERVTRNGKIPNAMDQKIPEKARGSSNSVDHVPSRSERDFIKRYSKDGSLLKYERLNNAPAPSAVGRNSYSELGFDESEICDQPIDYSKKYSEAKLADVTNPIPEFTNQSTTSIKKELESPPATAHQSKLAAQSVNYTDYQETDLDQPTDYSLRYAEIQSDMTSDSLQEDRPPSVHEDTMKHFCTEGTPYETPINFSTATSMSDLRTIGGDLRIGGKLLKTEPPSGEVSPSDIKQSAEIMSQSDEKDTCSLEDGTKHDNDKILAPTRNPSVSQVAPPPRNDLSFESKFSSGMISPEKPVNYCEEGTPGYFSRVSSLSSLEDGKLGDVEEEDWSRKNVENELAGHFTPPPMSSVVERDQIKEKDCIKAVTFDSNVMSNQGSVNYAEETPLMFSRCSSLESLSGCSVPDQPDDVGSVVSEFSRLTSGCISPSEIPDSPTHSPLPRGDSTAMTAPPVNRLTKPAIKNIPQPASRLRSVFEDEISTFKCEHTPVEFSTTTSLSSLTIDDEPSTTKVPLPTVFNIMQRTDGVGSSNPDDSKQCTPAGQVSGSLSSEEDDQEDHQSRHNDILASCIKQGANARIKIRNACIPPADPSSNTTLHRSSQDVESSQPALDTYTTYCTEDTPAVLSKAGSHSNLSVLSLLDDQGRDFSDDSSNISGENSNLLAQCISSGMNTNTKDKYAESQCPPRRNLSIPNKVDPPLRLVQNGLPPYLVSQDEVESYAVENSPFQHSFSSSLSDLTVDSSSENKARIIKSLPPVVSTPEKSGRNVGRESSPNGSLSSVELGSDDGHILDMVIQAGVPKRRDDHVEYSKDSSFVSNGRSSSLMDERKQQDVNVMEDKSDDHVTVLTRNDSLSSLSIESLGSNEGEQSILEQCIMSGMPKSRPNRSDIHSKTLDKNFKARSADRSTSNIQKNHSSSHRSLERSRDDSNMRHTHRDPEFESLVAAGAFRNCVPKISKTQEDVTDRMLLDEAAFVRPRRRDYQDTAVVPTTQQTQSEMFYPTNVDNYSRINRDFCDSDLSKNVQATSVAADTNPGAAADVKTAVAFGNTARDTRISGQITITPLKVTKYHSVTLGNITLDGSIHKHSFSGETSGVSPSNYKMKDGSNVTQVLDEADGNRHPKSIPEINNSFNDSVLDKSNECRALDTSSCLNDDSVVSELNMSNESCANYALDVTLEDCAKDQTPVVENKQETLIQSSTMMTSLKSNNQTDIDVTLLESVTEKDLCSSSGKIEKRSSTDTWNENTCPNDVSFPSVSGSVPMVTSFKSDFGEEYTCAGILPDLLEESVLFSEGSKKPDLTNQLSDTNENMKDKTPTLDKPFPKPIDMTQICNNLSISLSHRGDVLPTDSGQLSLTFDDSSSKTTSMSHSTIIENEAAMLARKLRDADYECPGLTESGHSLHSLDLDNINPPSHMGSLLSLSHSLSGNWNDNTNHSVDRDKLHSRKSHHRSQRKKSLPVSLMVKRALGYCHSNQGSSEHLDVNGIGNLDNIKPPSEMDDIFDMENSMVSVASIVSEVADTNDEDPSTIVFDLKQPYSGPHLTNTLSVSIDNVNPPSLFNELTESTLENEFDDENCLTQTLAYCPDIPSGSDSGTPIPSDFGSSAESTPKRVKANRRYLTPKQKRQIAKDRYKTYTIAAETAISEEVKIEIPVSYQSPLDMNVDRSSPSGSEGKRSKSNPKQKRLENRERYQTQTVNMSSITVSPPSDPADKTVVKDPEIEALKKRLEAKKSMKQKRTENSDRFRTRTLDESSIPSSDSTIRDTESSSVSSTPKPCSSSPRSNTSEYNHNQLSDNVAEAFNFLNQHHADELNNADLDCETMSLVSNEDDSELNSLRMRTFTRSFRNYLPVIESPTAVDKCMEKNLKNITHTAIHVTSFTCVSKPNDTGRIVLVDNNSLDCIQNSSTENPHSDSESETPQYKGKPKIVKPNNCSRDESVDSNESLEVEDNSPKSIRGRRKALYVSPYKRNGSVPKKSPLRTAVTVKSAKVPTPTKAANSISSKAQNGLKTSTNVTRVNYGSAKNPINSLNRNSTHVTKSKTAVNVRTKSPKNVEAPPKPVLARQGTFTKEESRAVANSARSPNSPENTISPHSKLTKPGTIVKAVVNTSPSRLPLPPKSSASVSKPPMRKTGNNEPPTTKAPSRTSGNITPKSSGGMKNSVSNQSLQSNDSGKTITLSSKPISSKSGSSSPSVNGNSSSSSKPQSKDVTSKIANLWKKVEQSKKTPTKPDTRVWITNGSSQGSSSQESSESPSDNPTNGKLIRSSTFDGSPKVSSIPTTPKQKSSIAIRIPQSPNKANSKVPVVRTMTERNSGIPSPVLKRGKV